MVGLGGLLMIAVIVVAPQTHLLPQSPHFRGVELDTFSSSVVPVLTLLMVVAGVGGWGLFQRKPGWNVFSLALLPTLLVLLGAGLFASIYEERSARSLASRLSTLAPETQLVFYRCFPNGLPFYLHRTGTLITAEGEELTSNYALYQLKKTSAWPSQIIPLNHFEDWLKSQDSSLYFIAKEQEQERINALASQHHAQVEKLAHHLLGVLLKEVPGA